MFILNDIKCIFLLVFTIIQWVICYEMSEDRIQVSEFDVIPGGALLSHESELNGFVCKFTYVCQGGTKEVTNGKFTDKHHIAYKIPGPLNGSQTNLLGWSMGISVNDENTKYLCSVERPGGKSYLFFQSFKLDVSGAQATEGEAMGSSNAPLRPSEYKIDLEKNSISEVPGKFGSQLEKIILYSEKGKTEL